MRISELRADAKYLYKHYKQSGPGVADTLFNQIVKDKQLTIGQKAALVNEFQALLKA